MKTSWFKMEAGRYARTEPLNGMANGLRFEVEYDPEIKLWRCRRNGEQFDAAATLREAKEYCVEPPPGK